ncbi:phage protease [Rhizobium sp. C1]|uniref:phage protease n=1 Tax=Rhizobium sp. C1 TaxID=1349799 RepID=UPI001E4A5096|nr:phage protease [Rhizobium sp. C1]MCD2176451.1 phage protease [Rhizobium sp. C1]
MLNQTASIVIALNAASGVPDWLQLLPSTSFSGVDGRGPYEAPDLNMLVAKFASEGRKLPIDENHAIDILGKNGKPSPARGWIVEMQAREDGLYGRVEWTAEGRELVDGKSYGFISPVFFHTKQKPFRIVSVDRAALTNDPNLPFLKSLNSRQEPDMLELLRKALGLPETATEEQVLEAVSSAHSARTKYDTLLKRVGGLVASDGDEMAVVTALQSRLASATAAGGDEVVKSLNSQIATLNSELATLKASHAQDRAVSVIDEAIKTGKLFPALRDHYIARHAKNPTEVEEELKLLPSIHSGSLKGRNPSDDSRDGQLSEADRMVIAQMGVSEEDFLKNRKLEKGV